MWPESEKIHCYDAAVRSKDIYAFENNLHHKFKHKQTAKHNVKHMCQSFLHGTVLLHILTMFILFS